MKKMSRRSFIGRGAATTAAGCMAASRTDARTHDPAVASGDASVLVDTTLCIGCRKCEEACNRRNHLPRTTDSFADREVFRALRRPSEGAFTVVNRFPGSPSPDQAESPVTYCKVQCMHCLHPSCVSACIVGALRKAPDGAVVYNPTICIGCRYCMVACPFEVLAYEYHTPLMPRVRKCEFCTDPASGSGASPACAAACPTETLVFGARADLLAIAKERVKTRPDRYAAHVYGENEVGGTGWLYLTGRPLGEVGLLTLPERAPALRTEAIQHGIFKYGILPLAMYGALAGIMWFNHRKHEEDGEGDREPSTDRDRERSEEAR